MSTAEGTKARILASARALLEEHGYHGVGLEDIAAAAGVSRQAVYLHFGSKSGLLLALVEWMDATADLGPKIAHVFSAPDAREALDRFVHLHATYDPTILAMARVLDAARRTDADAAAAWEDRMRARRGAAKRLCGWLYREGALAEGLTVETATDLWWAIASPATIQLLHQDRGWSLARYERWIGRTLRAALLGA